MAIRVCVRSIRVTALIGAALTTVGMRDAGATSPGCNASQSAFSLSARAGQTKSATVMGFLKGDVIVFNIAISNNSDERSGMWVLQDGNGTVVAKDGVGGTSQATYTVTGGADTTLTETVTAQETDRASVTVTVVSCTSSVTQGPGNDSQKARAAQILGSAAVGLASGAAISAAVDSAIADGLSGGKSAAPSPGPSAGSGPPLGLGAGSEQMSRLGATASRGASPSTAPATSEWKPWANVRGSGWDQDASSPGSMKGTQINATFGVGRLIASNVLVGIVGGYENFNYQFEGLASHLQGDGWTAGAYAGWAFTSDLRFDVMTAWTGLSYDDAAGTAAGSFHADRWFVSSGITGSYQINGFAIEPSSRLYALWERQDAWTDSLGTNQSERSFSIGRESTGAKIAYPWQFSPGNTLVPYVGLYGDYRFSSHSAVDVSEPFVALSNGWSARASLGAIMDFKGGRLSLEGEFAGMGTGDQLWTVTARGSIPFY